VNFLLVSFLGLALLGLVAAFIYLAAVKKPIPPGLTTLASLIAGGLLAILNPVHSGRRLLSGRTRRGARGARGA
jgi:hypothetical protein